VYGSKRGSEGLREKQRVDFNRPGAFSVYVSSKTQNGEVVSSLILDTHRTPM